MKPNQHSLELENGLLTVFCDGEVALPPELFSGVTTSEAEAILQKANIAPGPAPANVNAFVYKTATQTILIDAGGAGLVPELGGLSELLADSGIQASDIDTVFCTHLHPDHIGGLLRDGKPVFSNATVWVHEDELAFWGSASIRENAPDEAMPFFDAAQAVITGYKQQLHSFNKPTECAPGVLTVLLPGHTPGHTGLQIGNPQTGLFIWGDIVHVEALQLACPDASIAFDVNPQQAVETRKKVLENVVRDGTRVAGGHLSSPGFGRIRKADSGYAFEAERKES